MKDKFGVIGARRQIGAFFMINLCLVVIATQFSETKRRETERMQHERALRRQNSDSSSINLSPALSTSVSVFSTGASCYSEMIRYVEHLARRGWRRLRAVVADLRRRRRADIAGSADADELGTLQRQRARRRRGRRKAGATAVEVEMNSVSSRATGTRRQHHVTLASPRARAVASYDAEATLTGVDVTVRPASPLAPCASPEPSEVDQSSLALNRSISGEPRLLPPSATLCQLRNPRWSSPTGMEDVDLTRPRRSDDVGASRSPRSASSPRLHSQQTGAEKRGTSTISLSVHFRRQSCLFLLSFLQGLTGWPSARPRSGSNVVIA